MPSLRRDTRQRAVLIALLSLVGAVTIICVQASLNWIGRPFNGFLLGRNRIVAPITQPSWSGAQAGVPYRAQLIAINGKPVTSTQAVLAAAARAGDGHSLTYTFVRNGKVIKLPIKVITFTVADYLGLFGNYLLNGLAFLVIGFFVILLRPRQAAARAMLLFSLSWGLVLITSLEDFATFYFREVNALAHAAAPASLLYLASRFPTEHPWARRRSWPLLLIGVTAVVAVLDISLYDRAPAAWMHFFDITVLWIALAVLLSVGLMWVQYHAAADAIAREKIKIVFLGAVVAFAFPSAAALGGYLIGAALPLNVLFAVTWVFPAALAYAIVKRDLFEIDVFLRRAASYIALSAAVFVLYVAVVALFSRSSHSLSFAASPWFTLIFSLAILAVVRPLRDWLQAGVDRVFFRTHFDYAEITESVSQALTRTLDTGEIAARLQYVVAQTMAPTMCSLFVHASGDGGTFHCIEPSVPALSLDAETRRALRAGQILSGAQLPVGTSLSAAALLAPLCFETQLEGVLLLGPKKSGAAYGPRDLELLRTLANQTATALRNAASYRRVTELLSSLETRVQARTRELQHTQAELRASNEKLRELDRLKTEFFSEVSHELRTPLTLVLGPLEQLRQHASVWPPETRRLLDLAHGNSAKLLVLTDTLLELSRLDAGRLQPVRRAEQLGRLLERIAEPFLWLAEQRSVRLRLRHTDLPLTVWCDAGMVSKIVGNLLANALKFTSSGSIEVDLEHAGNEAGIRVADTGPGIPASELPHIFDRYRQASTARRSTLSGSGLGLALVREFTELHGGHVDVSSDEGRGTTFTVWIPIGAPPAAEPARTGSSPAIPSAHLAALAAAGRPTTAAAEPATHPARSAPSVLVVDDNAGLLDFLRDLLAPAYQVQTAANAQEALAAVGVRAPDIILCDVMMPGPDGLAFCQRLKRDDSLRHVPVILLTARASLDSKLSGLAAGADDYITKPFHPDELKARMAAVLRVRRMERELSRSHAELASAYDDLRAAQAQLIQAEKMASLGTLVAGVAHEINNPVSFVNSSIDLISSSIAELRQILDRHLHQAGAGQPALERLRADLDYEYRMQMLQENAAICREGASRAARIVSDLRTFCRPGTGRREATDLRDSLEQSLRLLQGECKGRVTVHREYTPVPPVLCDKGQMSQVFVNLLANAIQAIDGRGDVFIRTRSANGSVIVEIEDTGHGMDEGVASRLFDPFFTTKEVGKGTGLGLSIVRSLVTAHGGDIQVRSTVGQGSTFTLNLPINGAQHE
ncbi:MAG: ATP-binding protein [Candidatus Binatia bacterium]